MSTKIQTVIKAGAMVIALLLTTGCANLQTQIDAIDARVDDLAADAVSVAEVRQIALAAQATADEALAAAELNAACCDATNEKIDRMFERSQSK